MSNEKSVTAQHWNKQSARFSGRDTGLFWLEKLEIQRSINRKVSGDPNTNWIQYTLQKYFDGQLPLTKCLSLGCGEGRVEREIISHGAVRFFDAYDIAEGSIHLAKQRAKAEGFNNINYFVADINELTLPVSVYDAVWIDSAMHHFKDLEHVCMQVKLALKPNGLLILNEYIGPNRFQFPARQREVASLCLKLLPTRYRVLVQESINIENDRTLREKGAKWLFSRLIDKIREGGLLKAVQRRFQKFQSKIIGKDREKSNITFPSVRDVIADDPSEAVRSEEIVKVLKQEFEIIEKKDWGGNLLQYLLAEIAGNFTEDDQSSQEFLKMLINIEDTLLQNGEFQSDFAFIVARPLTK